ncbi:MAG TPA: dihydrodipicolinate synthase family protein [Candidatus Brocadiia bacterium]|nr:dihydrodipicolinate synthase family protein [Candidatus Brocadiia bacterium]
MNLDGKLFPAVPVPFGPDGEIDREAQQRYIEWMSGQPVGGVAVWVHTGRGLRLTDRQREYVLRSWREGMPRGAAIIAGAGARPEIAPKPEAVMSDALRMAKQARDFGADALLAHPPTALRGLDGLDDMIVGYHDALAGADLPLICFYLYEAAGGISYSPDVLDRLFTMPAVAGIKMATLDSVCTYQEVAALISERFPGKTLVTGEDRFLGYSIMLGARAALIGMGAASVAMQSRLLNSWIEGDFAAFARLSAKVDKLAMRTFVKPMEGYIQRMLWCLAFAGVISWDATRDPWGPALPREQREALRVCLAELGEDTSHAP